MSFHGITTAKQLEKEWDKLKDSIFQIGDFSQNKEEKEKRLEKAKKSFKYFRKTYLERYFFDDEADFHKEWDDIRYLDNEPILIEAMRGSGKSTYWTFADVIYRALFGKTNFSLIVSYSDDKAKVFVGRILLELKYNPRINSDFNLKWYKEEIGNIQFEVNKEHKVCIKSFSIGQNVRGEVFFNFRPDTVRVDDIQDRKRAKSQKFVDNCLEWLFADLLPAMNPKRYNFIIVATPMNNRCVVSQLKNGDKEKERRPLKTFSYPAINKNGKATWEKRFPLEKLEQIKKYQGTLFFNQEYLLVPVSNDEKVFKSEWIRYYDEIDVKELKYIISWTDSSLTSKGDYKATVCIGSDGDLVYILHARVKKESVNQMLNGMYSIYQNYHPFLMYYEDYSENKDNQTILHEAILTKQQEKGFSLPLKPVRNTINKQLRIEGTLSTELENGKILFLKDDEDQKIIIDEIIKYPDVESDDGVDALEGAVRMIRELIRKEKRSSKIFIPKVSKVIRKSSITELNYE